MFNLNDCIGVITNKYNKEIIEAFNNRVLSHGITRVQWIAIYYIGQNEGITQKQLSYILDSNESSIVRLVDRMEKDDMVKREKDENDRRITRLYLTDYGNKKREEIIPIGEKFSNDSVKNISEKDLETFKNVLNQIVNNLKNT